MRSSVNLAHDVIKNQMLKQLEEFDRRYLRLKIVQDARRREPTEAEGGNAGGGLGFDADNLSMSNASHRSESAMSGQSSSRSSISQTSKKSMRQSKKGKKKRKLREPKQGSPFEEENLIEVLKDGTKLSVSDQAAVKVIIDALVFFGQVEASQALHALAERLMRAEAEVAKLWTVEQAKKLAEDPDFVEYFFPDQLAIASKTDAALAERVSDWENLKFFKH